MEGVVRSVEVVRWEVLVSHVKQMKFCAASLHVAFAQGAISQMWLYARTVGISGSEVAAVATKMTVGKLPSYLRF